jgi:hypothetical protein
MSFLLGFGSTEREVEVAEGKRVDYFLSDMLAGNQDAWFTDKIAEDLKKLLTERKKELDDRAAEYKIAVDPPERYSTFNFRVLHDISDLVVVFKFSHINRKHPMSPDGWALWQNTHLHHADVWNYRE